MSWALLQNSLWVSAAVTLVATAFGLAAALFVAGLEPAWKASALAVAVMAFALPPFLVTNCWLDLLGFTGWLKRWLPLSIYSTGGTVWVLALLLWPLALFASLGAWAKLDPAQLDSEPALAGAALVRHLLAPCAWPALAPAALTTFVLALNNFSVPAILQVKVLPAEVWLQFSTNFDYGAALTAALPLVLAPAGLLFALRGIQPSWPRSGPAVSAAQFRGRLGRGWWTLMGAVACVLALLSVALPLSDLVFARRSWVELPAAFAAGQSAVLASAGFALLTATLAVVGGLGLWRWRAGALAWLAFFIPGLVLGIALIFLLNRPPFLALYQSMFVVVVALTIRYLGIGWHGVRAARLAADADLVDAARLSGARGWCLFRHVLWPQIAPPLAGTWYVVYLLALWDVETIVLIVPPGGETLALRVFNLLHYGHNAQVNALCLLLLGLAVAPLLAWRALRWFRRAT